MGAPFFFDMTALCPWALSLVPYVDICTLLNSNAASEQVKTTRVYSMYVGLLLDTCVSRKLILSRESLLKPKVQLPFS